MDIELLQNVCFIFLFASQISCENLIELFVSQCILWNILKVFSYVQMKMSFLKLQASEKIWTSISFYRYKEKNWTINLIPKPSQAVLKHCSQLPTVIFQRRPPLPPTTELYTNHKGAQNIFIFPDRHFYQKN